MPTASRNMAGGGGWQPERFDPATLFPQIRDDVSALRESMDEALFDSYILSLTSFLRDTRRLIDLDEFVASNFSDSQRELHSTLFLRLIDGCQLEPESGSAGSLPSSSLPHVSQIAARLLLQAAIRGIHSVESGCAEQIATTVQWRTRCVVEDTARLCCPHSYSSSGFLRIDNGLRGRRSSRNVVLRRRDFCDAFEMAKPNELSMMSDEQLESRKKLVAAFAEKKE